MLFSTVTATKGLLTVLLGLICVGGDRLVDVNKESPLLKAISDNLTHGLVGLVSYLVVVIDYRTSISLSEQLLLTFACFIIACGIDVDHFIMARSWKLIHATSLPSRPYLHCSTIPLIFLILTFFASKFSFRLTLWTMMVFCAFLSHHIRDSTRRGLWFFGYGHTSALPYYVYVTAVMALPWIVIRIIDSLTVIKHSMTYNRVVDV
ncbi:transmembrane protein 267 [Culicoides brevitarsis]|uniref:transmembrane protein 267 n=1 Tax=Culicoides brevitarsis TaxID=469753 RepID=UPI00307B56B8